MKVVEYPRLTLSLWNQGVEVKKMNSSPPIEILNVSLVLFCILIKSLSAYSVTATSVQCSGACRANLSISTTLAPFENSQFINVSSYLLPPTYSSLYNLSNPVLINISRLNMAYLLSFQWQARYYSAFEGHVPDSKSCVINGFFGSQCFDWKDQPWLNSDNSFLPPPSGPRYIEQSFNLCCGDDNSVRPGGLYCLRYNYTNLVDHFYFNPSLSRIANDFYLQISRNHSWHNFSLLHSLSEFKQVYEPFSEEIIINSSLSVPTNNQTSQFKSLTSSQFSFFEDIRDVYYPLPPFIPVGPDTGFPDPHPSLEVNWFVANSSDPNLEKIGITCADWSESATCNQLPQSVTATQDPQSIPDPINDPSPLYDQFAIFRSNSVLWELVSLGFLSVPVAPASISATNSNFPIWTVPFLHNTTVEITINVFNVD